MQTISEVRDGFKETEIGLIPSDWDIKQLREILNLSNGRRPEFTERGVYPVFGANGIMGHSNNFLTDNDFTLIIGRVGASGQVHLASGRIWVSDNAIYSRTYDKIKIDLRFLYFLLKEIDLSRYATKTTHPLITQSFLNSFKIPLPDLPEQRNIAFVLSKIQQAIQQQDKIIEATKNLKKSLMHKLFTEGTRGEEQKETEIGLMPKSWEVKPLGEVVSFFQYGLSVKGTKQARYPIIRMNNLDDGYILCDDLQYVNLDDKTFNRFRLIKGDILFNRTNSIDLVGKTSIFDLEGDFVFASYLIRLKVKQEAALPRFVVYYLNWDKSQARLKGLATRAVGQSNISATRLRTFLIPLPSLSEQQQITITLSRLDRKVEIEKRKKSLIQQLFKTTLNKLMTGEIRVKDLDLGVINVS
jgi:type I restriction enzyme S subunit